MIVDAHVHLWGKGWRPAWNQSRMTLNIARLRGLSLDEARALVGKTVDPTGEGLLAEMNLIGLNKALIFRVDYGVAVPGEISEVPLEEQHRQTAETVRRHPDWLAWCASIDPRRPKAAQFVKKAITEWGARGLKLYCACGFYPNDRLVYPLYEVLQEHRAPVMFHVGPCAGAPGQSKYTHPLHLEDVAIDFPELIIHAGHGGVGHAGRGFGWYQDMMAVAELKENIVIDTAVWQEMAKSHPWQFYKYLRNAVDVLGAHRVMYGTDYWSPAKPSYGWFLKMFQEIPQEVKAAGINFTEEEKKAILGSNAARIYKL